MDIKSQISALSEDDLREKIVIPMLNALGAYAVEKFHGPRERGKDVYFAYRDIFDDFKHCCFFIKAGDITKSGRNDIRKMDKHMEEALFSSFPSPLDSHSEIFVEEFYFVCNGKVNKEARDYLSAQFRVRRMPNVKILDIDYLVEIIISKLVAPYNLETKQGYVFEVDSFANKCAKIKARNLGIRQTITGSAMQVSEGRLLKDE